MCRNQHRGQRYKQHQQQYQQRPKQVAAVQSVVISDTMTVRDLARALDITPAVLDGKMIDLGEIVESEEDMCVPFKTACPVLCKYACLFVSQCRRCTLPDVIVAVAAEFQQMQRSL